MRRKLPNPHFALGILVSAFSLSLALTSCSMQGTFRRQSARLRVNVEPPQARVYLNDRFLGSGTRLAQVPAEVRIGSNYITVKADGYFPHDLRLVLPPGETRILVQLRAIPE